MSNDDDNVKAEIKKLVNMQLAKIFQNYAKARTAYQNPYGLPELDPLRHEIAICIAFGLNQAAITPTNHFLESLLKYALIYQHTLKQDTEKHQVRGRAVKAVAEFCADGKKLFGNKNLNETIDYACRNGLITKDEKKMLHKYREIFRNAYGHADKEKTFGDAQTSAFALRVEGNAIVNDSAGDIRLADFLPAQGLFQVALAEEHAAPYYLSIDKLARGIKHKLFPEADQPGKTD
ncbi:MAG TPA: hypothetical protein VMP11_12640 [Verrucomicrobiae bacterium]|nr:hypothetical protein [Verrucomicrobiae bacterium]